MGTPKENKMTSKLVSDIKLMKIPGLEIIRIVPGIYGSMKGKSDIICCYHGFFVAIEMKRSEDDKPTKLQARFLRKIKEAKGFSGICHSKKEVLAFLKETLSEIKQRLS